jgi:hypothetical protein
VLSAERRGPLEEEEAGKGEGEGARRLVAGIRRSERSRGLKALLNELADELN